MDIHPKSGVIFEYPMSSFSLNLLNVGQSQLKFDFW